MRTSAVILGTMLALSMMVLTGTVSAESGVGVCAAGQGFSLYAASSPSVFVGVNAGLNSTSGAFTTRADYEKQCCAEVGGKPDCFAAVA